MFVTQNNTIAPLTNASMSNHVWYNWWTYTMVNIAAIVMGTMIVA